MNFSSEQIETITTSVLRELKSRGVAIAAARPLNEGPAVSSTLLEKVITEATLTAANAAGRSISVPAGAVITPSGHDYIRRNGVIITSSASSVSAAKATRHGVVIIVGESSAASSAARAAGWSTIAAGCEFDAATKARGELSGPVVCCGGEASVTACLLNRDGNVRAAVVTQKTDVERLGKAMNPQVICVDASVWTFAELRQLFQMQSTIEIQTPAKWKELAR